METVSCEDSVLQKTGISQKRAIWWGDTSVLLRKSHELHYKYLTWITCTTIQLHSHGNVSMPCLWKNSNILGLDWLDQITNDNGILIPAAGVFLRLNNILRFARYFEKTYSSLITVNIQFAIVRTYTTTHI